MLQINENGTAKGIFNVNETGLFYKFTSFKSLAFKGERCSDVMERITLLLWANMDGSENRQFLMIRKSVNLRHLKNLKTKPFAYESNYRI